MYTSLQELKDKGCCRKAYVKLAKSLGGVRKYGRDKPIPLSYVFTVCGLGGFLWLKENTALIDSDEADLDLFIERSICRLRQKSCYTWRTAAERAFAKLPRQLEDGEEEGLLYRSEIAWQTKELNKILTKWEIKDRKLIHKTITRLRELAMKEDSPLDCDRGICFEVGEAAVDNRGRSIAVHALAYQAMRRWPKRSKAVDYPVPAAADRDEGAATQRYAEGDLWGDHKYGDLRRELCLFVGDYLEQVLFNDKELAEISP